MIVKMKMNKLVYIYILFATNILFFKNGALPTMGSPNNIGWNGFYANSGSYVRKGTERD